MLVRSWASTSVVVARERVRIATVTRGAFVRDIAAQGTVVVANSPTLFASGVGTVTFAVKAGDAVAEGQVLATVDSPSLRNEHAREKAALDGLVRSRSSAPSSRRDDRCSKASRPPISRPRRFARRNASSNARQSGWDSGVIPRRDLDKARDQRDDAKLVYEHAIANAKLHEDSLNFELKTQASRHRARKSSRSRSWRAKSRRSPFESPVKGMVGSLAVNQKAAVAENAALAHRRRSFRARSGVSCRRDLRGRSHAGHARGDRLRRAQISRARHIDLAGSAAERGQRPSALRGPTSARRAPEPARRACASCSISATAR